MNKRNSLSSNLPSRYQDSGKGILKGGFGTAQILIDSWLDREVLLKTIKDPVNRQTLDREVKVVSSVSSKHVVRIFDVVRDASGECEGIIYEYLPGDPLEPGDFPVGSDLADYLKVLYQLSSGLTDIHAANFAHRDIKLQNIKRDAEGLLKIFDFGISSEFGETTKVSRGTLIFRAPELFSTPATIESPVDIYALGVCAFALISSAIPAPLAERPPQSISKMQSIASLRPDIPDDLVALLDKALATNPNARPTAAEIRDCIHRNLVRNQHQIAFIGLEPPLLLNSLNRTSQLKLSNIGEIQIHYDGVQVVATKVSGEVFINNRAASANTVLHDSCVITFGNPERGARRRFVELNSSRPEVVL